MKGSDLKAILERDGVSLTLLASKLGYSSFQALYSVLKSENIKTELLENIARVTNKSVIYYYGGFSVTTGDNSPASVHGDTTANVATGAASVAAGGDVSGVTTGGAEIEILKERIKSLEALVAEKEQRIAEKSQRIADKEEMIKLLRGPGQLSQGSE